MNQKYAQSSTRSVDAIIKPLTDKTIEQIRGYQKANRRLSTLLILSLALLIVTCLYHYASRKNDSYTKYVDRGQIQSGSIKKNVSNEQDSISIAMSLLERLKYVNNAHGENIYQIPFTYGKNPQLDIMGNSFTELDLFIA
ncbi:MAG: hypothetical protein U1C33_06155, partial [Candidatus Cloacimonadaceae bacterium]|nr:hypothetical protein [Candidatus Cloacimonadaceae bacterium]